jgi:hypothetical protein
VSVGDYFWLLRAAARELAALTEAVRELSARLETLSAKLP